MIPIGEFNEHKVVVAAQQDDVCWNKIFNVQE